LTACGPEQSVVDPVDDEKGDIYNFPGLVNARLGLPLSEDIKYADYGCYCGVGGGGATVDATDVCCMEHDECYRQSPTSCKCYVTHYSWEGKLEDVRCLPNDWIEKACADYCCACDLTVANCFASARGSFSDAYHDYDGPECK
jgi:secretory phospholipase A2